MTTAYLLSPEVERENRRKSAIISIAIFIALLVIAWLMVFPKFEVDFPPQGIMVQFGMTETGSGDEEPAPSEESASASAPVESVEEPVETYETPQSVPLTSKPQTTPTTTPTETPKKDPKVFRPTEGRGTSPNQGPGGDPGNAGDPMGGDEGAYKGQGMGPVGTGRGVGGRGWTSKPDLSTFHQVQETLKVNIYARKDGTITDVKVVGGTLTDPTLIGKIVSKIKQGRLNPDPNAPEIELLATWTIRFALD